LNLLRGLLRGDTRALAKAISIIEDGGSETENLLNHLYFHTGRAWVVGLTGPPGTGKSTLLTRLALEYRKKGLKIGILAFDPTSPFTGGAFLGDRFRMVDLAGDQSIFIRSMASRGGKGGLTREARNAVRLLDAFGKDMIFVETVGTGQADIEISKVADVVIVVLMPELGDEIQMSKAGLMEAGDIFVVNKADLPRAHKLVSEIRQVLGPRDGWKPMVLKTTAARGIGTSGVVAAIEDHKQFSTVAHRRQSTVSERSSHELLEVLKKSFDELLEEKISQGAAFRAAVEDIAKRRTHPRAAGKKLLNTILRSEFRN